ncbi:hypothetical protein Ahia01_000972100 [Argonauta hians]
MQIGSVHPAPLPNTRKLKSDINIQQNHNSAVVTVVANTFNSIVLDKTKDVLIELYAPWCGHCKQLEPIYKLLAKKMMNEKNLIIAKMDATINAVPPTFKVDGYPTIYFAPTTNKDRPIEYTGMRELNEFVRFLEKHRTC